MPNLTTRRIQTSDIQPTPWKNGGGVTREIATGAVPQPGESWGWRVSLADVAQDGPFSIFPGVDRMIAVIEGAGMDLIAPDGQTIALEPFQPVRLDGETELSGRLRRGAVRDLNVMVRRAQFSAEMEIAAGSCRFPAETGSRDCLLVYSLAGRCAVRVDDGEPQELALGEALLHEGQGRFDVQLMGGSRAAIIRIRPR